MMKKHHEKQKIKISALKILIIEGNDIDAAAILKTVCNNSHGAKCTRVCHLEEGDNIVEKGKTDIILMALRLPNNGDLAATREKIRKWVKKIPVIVMANLEDHSLVREMIHEGATDFLNKDCLRRDPKRIVEHIEFSIEHHIRHKELMSDMEKTRHELEVKEAVLNCFMGGYSCTKP